MNRDEEAERMIKKMLKELFKLTDDEVGNFHAFRIGTGGPIPNILPMAMQNEPEEVAEPLIEIFEKDKYFSVLIDTSGYTEEQIFLNIKKEEGKTNLIFGVTDVNGRMVLRRMELPAGATEIFERETRGAVVELKVQKTK